jgi:4-amino-4-deoxy-L-arabinose transferase-like glycosyltransferase
MNNRLHYVLIFSLALLLRILVFYELRDVDPIATGTDMLRYYQQAQQLSVGNWPEPAVFHFHPLMPLIIASSFRLFGPNKFSPQLLNAIIGALACPLLALVGAKLFDRRVGIMAGWSLALYQGHVFYSTAILDIPVATLALIAALWVIAEPTPRTGVIAGLLLTLGILGRGILLVTAATTIGWLIVTRNYRSSVILLVTIIVCLTPVVARNAYYGHATITNNGPLNLWIGNNPDANGTYNIHQGGEAHEAAIAVSRSGKKWVNEVVQYIKKNPLDWLQLTIRKAAMFVILPDGFMPNNVNLVFDGLANSWLLRVLPGYWIFFILAIAGIFTLRSQWRKMVPLAVIYVPYTATTTLFFVLTRFRVPITIVPILLSALVLIDIRGKIGAMWASTTMAREH